VKRETRYDYAAAVAMRYQRSSREQKGWILDEFCAASHQAAAWTGPSRCAAAGPRTSAGVRA
jgi:hypothetical protein